jgi:hypothetical protein
MKMAMRFLIGVSFIAISACGGSGGGSDDPVIDDPVTLTNCVLGTSTIGECKI